MRQLLKFTLLLTLLLGALHAETDFRIWNSFFVHHEFAKNLEFDYEGVVRFRNNGTILHQYYNQVRLETRPSKLVKIAAGFRVEKNLHNHQWQERTYTIFDTYLSKKINDYSFQARFRNEVRFQQKDWLFRVRARTNFPEIVWNFRPYVSEELLLREMCQFHQNRIEAGLLLHIKEWFLRVGYIYRVEGTREWNQQNILNLSAFLRF